MRFRRHDFRLDSFERVEVGPGLALLRLSGRWRAGTSDGVRLVATVGGAAEELPQLPDPPPDGSGLWRAAFSADVDVLDDGVDFQLQRADGPPIPLPGPVDRGLGASTLGLEPAEAEPAAEPEPETDPEPGARPRPVVPATGVAGLEATKRTLEEERARHERTEASLREQLRIMVSETADFMGRLEGYELRRAELEKELGWERLLHKETQRLRAEAEGERDAARRLVGELRAKVAHRNELLQAVRTGVDRGSARLADLEERLIALREVGQGISAQNGDVPPDASSRRRFEALARVRATAGGGIEQLSELEERLTKLRASIVETGTRRRVVAERPRRRRFLR